MLPPRQGDHRRFHTAWTTACRRRQAEGVQISNTDHLRAHDEVRNAMAGLLDLNSGGHYRRRECARSSISQGGRVAGCMVQHGRMVKGARSCAQEVIHDGIIQPCAATRTRSPSRSGWSGHPRLELEDPGRRYHRSTPSRRAGAAALGRTVRVQRPPHHAESVTRANSSGGSSANHRRHLPIEQGESSRSTTSASPATSSRPGLRQHFRAGQQRPAPNGSGANTIPIQNLLQAVVPGTPASEFVVDDSTRAAMRAGPRRTRRGPGTA
jgi:hypothetical protein